MCFFPFSGAQLLKSLVCVPAGACVCVSACASFCAHNVLAGGTSVLKRLRECGIVCTHVSLCCLPAGQAVVGTGDIGAGWCCSVVDYFLPYIAMTGHVISPVVVSGQ